MAPAPAAVCTAPDTITIGAASYNGSGAVVWAADPTSKQLTNSAAPPTGSGTAFSCTGSKITATAGAVTAGGGFSAAYAGLKVVVTRVRQRSPRRRTTGTANTLTLAAACPAGVTTSAGTAVIGEPGANAPKNGSAMASLSAELNLAPTLVATQDDCNKNTFEGFQVIGEWNNPGGYGGGLGPPVTVSAGQISFPTSVISFGAYVRPQPTGDALLAGAHYEFVFPLFRRALPSARRATAPSNPTAISFGINPTVLATAPVPADRQWQPRRPVGTGHRSANRCVRRQVPTEEQRNGDRHRCASVLHDSTGNRGSDLRVW